MSSFKLVAAKEGNENTVLQNIILWILNFVETNIFENWSATDININVLTYNDIGQKGIILNNPNNFPPLVIIVTNVKINIYHLNRCF